MSGVISRLVSRGFTYLIIVLLAMAVPIFTADVECRYGSCKVTFWYSAYIFFVGIFGYPIYAL